MESAGIESTGRPPDGRAGFLHVDMDAFFAAVEIRRHPKLADRPVIVGGAGRRGVVAAASYAARSFGVHSAMASIRARRLCPDAVFLPGDYAQYAEVSGRIMELLRDVTPWVEPLSLDEAFLDVRGALRLSGPPVKIARALRQRIFEQEGLTCSVGIATTKFIAKMATNHAKPGPSRSGPVFGSGVFLVRAGAELDFLHPLPVGRLWGVGPATSRRLATLGVETIADLASLPVEVLKSSLGTALGAHLNRLAHGIDERGVVTTRSPRSIGHEETYPHDLVSRDQLDLELIRLCDSVASRLRAAGLCARTITIKVRFGDFTTLTRSLTLQDPVDSLIPMVAAAAGLLDRIDPTPGVRLLGVSCSGLVEATSKQLSILDLDPAGSLETDQVVDDIRGRFGAGSIGPAALARPGERLKVREYGSQQWGPHS